MATDAIHFDMIEPFGLFLCVCVCWSSSMLSQPGVREVCPPSGNLDGFYPGVM